MFWNIRRLLRVLNEITLYEFNSLTKKEKAEALCEFAVFLLERPDPVFRIALYQVHNFYVEVKYDKLKNAIAEFQLFTTTKLVEPYLHQIDISSLIAC
ncbi:MAG: hypothetical protein ABIN97_21160 [Ginsengibacter sp.]